MRNLFQQKTGKLILLLLCAGVLVFLVMTVNEKMKSESDSFLSAHYFMVDVNHNWEIRDTDTIDQVRSMIEAVKEERRPLQIDKDQIKYGREDTAFILTFYDGKNTEEYFFGHDSVGSLNGRTGESYWQYASVEENYLAMKELIVRD